MSVVQVWATAVENVFCYLWLSNFKTGVVSSQNAVRLGNSSSSNAHIHRRACLRSNSEPDTHTHKQNCMCVCVFENTWNLTGSQRGQTELRAGQQRKSDVVTCDFSLWSLSFFAQTELVCVCVFLWNGRLSVQLCYHSHQSSSSATDKFILKGLCNCMSRYQRTLEKSPPLHR